MVKKQIIISLLALFSVNQVFSMARSKGLVTAISAGVSALGVKKAFCTDQAPISKDEQRLINLVSPKMGPDDFVKSALLRSGTLWRGSKDWQDKITTSGVHADTKFEGHIGYDTNGTAEFKLDNHRGMVSVEAKFETTTINPTDLKFDFDNGTSLKLQEGHIRPPVVSGEYARCYYLGQIRRQIPSDLHQVLIDEYNRPNCTSLNCQHPECVRLKQIRLERDITKNVYAVLFGNNPKTEFIRKATCYANFPVDVLFANNKA